ncbi:acetoin utilization protein AcuC [Nakamurella flava]|uniref:Acetoin utilization protein AcuC n=1 Tax=Nakamurella flava TaxID=2576308 RepID=A0A4U6QJH8_9ACTN|nr:acetoin utilization protein AcuC [Nakamurella flava]TKV60228.1 acetoin utilization protein AcuC [Nakamurella flava]
MTAPVLVWDDRMLEYDLGGRHPLHPIRWQLTRRLAEPLGVLDGYRTITAEPATTEELQRCHTADYISTVRAASEFARGPEDPRYGHGLGGPDNPIFPAMHDSAARIAAGSMAAARAIARGETDRAVNIFGGLHHAHADHASGFCVYNDAALAITALLDEGVERVAYVDVDVHHGDGVQSLFEDDPRVLTVSIHESPMTLFPGTGWATETGRGPGHGTAVNIPVPAGTDDAAWLRAFHAVVPGAVRAFRPQVLVTQHGADAHRDDPLADLQLTVDGQRTAYLALRDLAEELTGGRWLALGGGGYEVIRVVPRAWTHLLAVVAGRELDPATDIPAAWSDLAVDLTDRRLPTTMSDLDGGTGAVDGRGRVGYHPWQGAAEQPVDRAIRDVRAAAFPLLGLDPLDPRD